MAVWIAAPIPFQAHFCPSLLKQGGASLRVVSMAFFVPSMTPKGRSGERSGNIGWGNIGTDPSPAPAATGPSSAAAGSTIAPTRTAPSPCDTARTLSIRACCHRTDSMLFAAVAGILENGAADAAFASATMFAASTSVAAGEDLKLTIRVPSTKKWPPTYHLRGISSRLTSATCNFCLNPPWSALRWIKGPSPSACWRDRQSGAARPSHRGVLAHLWRARRHSADQLAGQG
jgi:hypothetical protein